MVRASGTATTTVLTITAGLVPTSSVTTGTVVTLTASVSTIALVPVTAGTVTFCDATATFCVNGALIGTAQLTSGATATIKFVPAIGNHNYYAIFNGASVFIGSNSHSALQPLSVTGTFPTTSSISHSGAAGNYTLTGTVVGSGSTSLSPTGSVSFIDTSNGNFPLGSPTLGSSTFVHGFAAAVPYASGLGPSAIAVGDFNNDGIPDLAVVNQTAGTVSVLLGNPDGTFQSQLSYTVGNTPVAVALGDLRGVGKQDLVVVNSLGNTVSVLLGVGDGTFGLAGTDPTGNGPISVAIGDLNNDGILDLAVADNTTGKVGILIGNGLGGFAAEVPYTVGANPVALVAGDFNGDGILDLAVVNKTDGTVSVLLGVGNGTFGGQTAYTANANPTALAAADLNADGKLDLVVANSSANTVSVLLNSGSGAFGAAATYSTGNNPVAVAVGDFDGDANEDVAVVNRADNTVSLLLGGPTGALQARTSFSTGTAPVAVVATDFDGDGHPDLAVVNNSAAGISVLLDSLTQTATAFVTGISIPGSGTAHLIEASYPGDTNFSLSTSPTTSLTSTAIATTLTLGAVPASSAYGQSVTLTATLSPATDGALTTDGDPVTFKSGGVSVGTGTLSGGVATLIPTTLPAGIDSLTAVYPGDANFAGSTSVAANFTVSKAVLTVTAQDATRAFGVFNPPFTAVITGFVNGDTQATSTTGLPRLTTAATTASPVTTYPIVAAVGTLASTSYSFTFVDGTLTVTQATPTITWATPAAITYGTALSSTQLDATASKPGTFVYAPPATTVLTAGSQSLMVTFTPTDGVDFTGATKTVTITVNKAKPIITWATPVAVPSATALTITQLNATASVPGAFVYVPALGAVPPDGLDTLSTTFTPTDTTDYTTATASVVLTVGAVFDLAVTGTGSDEIGSHGVATYRFEVSPASMAATLPGAVTFSVSGLPPGATAKFSPAMIAAGSKATLVDLSIRLARNNVGSLRTPTTGSAAPTALGMLLFPILGLLFVAKSPRRLPRRVAVILLALVSLGTAIGLTSCAGTTTPPVTTTYPMVLTATSGNLQHSVNLTLIVNE